MAKLRPRARSVHFMLEGEKVKLSKVSVQEMTTLLKQYRELGVPRHFDERGRTWPRAESKKYTPIVEYAYG